MSFVQWNDKVQTFSAHCPDDPLADRIGHRCPHRRFEHPQPHVPNTLVHLFGENRVAIMDEEAIGMVNWDRLAKLLKGPCGSGMGRDTHVKERTTRILNYHKDIEDSEGA